MQARGLQCVSIILAARQTLGFVQIPQDPLGSPAATLPRQGGAQFKGGLLALDVRLGPVADAGPEPLDQLERRRAKVGEQAVGRGSTTAWAQE